MSWKHFATWAVALLFGPDAALWAAPIVITTPGFESPVDAVSNTGPITGWTIQGSGAGVWNINFAPLGFWNTLAPEGNQVGYVGRENPPGVGASISQVLSATLQANAIYTLTGQVGHPIGFGSTPNPDTVFTVELLAGNSTLASLSGTGPEGSFSPFQLTFDSTGSSLIGQALQIRLSSSKTQTAFDALQLDGPAVVVPEPATLWIALTGALCLLCQRRRGLRRTC